MVGFGSFLIVLGHHAPPPPHWWPSQPLGRYDTVEAQRAGLRLQLRGSGTQARACTTAWETTGGVPWATLAQTEVPQWLTWGISQETSESCGESLGKGPGNLPRPDSASQKCETSGVGTACAGEQEATPPARTQDQGPSTWGRAVCQWGLTTPGTPEDKGPTKPRGLS